MNDVINMTSTMNNNFHAFSIASQVKTLDLELKIQFSVRTSMCLICSINTTKIMWCYRQSQMVILVQLKSFSFWQRSVSTTSAKIYIYLWTLDFLQQHPQSSCSVAMCFAVSIFISCPCQTVLSWVVLNWLFKTKNDQKWQQAIQLAESHGGTISRRCRVLLKLATHDTYKNRNNLVSLLE